METTKQKIERLKKLDAERTQGEWRNQGEADGRQFEESPAVRLGEYGVVYDEGGHTVEDARFIAAAPTMIAVIAELEQRLAVARDCIAELKRCSGAPITDRQAEEKWAALVRADATLVATDLDKPFP